MSKMMCKCDVAIYYSKEIEDTLEKLPDIHLADFLTGWDEKHQCQRNFMRRKEPVDYWYCPECQRIYEAQCKPYGRWLRIYQRILSPAGEIDFKSYTRIYVMPDQQTSHITFLYQQEELSAPT